ncbi:MAG: chloride channel protein, partial [candidate division NC10 bacterium]
MAEEKEEQGASPGYLRRILLRLAYHPRIPEGAYLTVVSILVGLATGVGSVTFIKLLQYTTHFFFETGRGALTLLGEYYVILLPAIGGLIVGPLIYRFAQEAKGHGVPEVMTAMAVKGGRIRKRVAFAKIVTSALTIGSGGSAGREGPMIQIGAGIGSTVGQFLKMSDERIKTLVACGAAGGIAATFNAPIAGAMFALEIFMGQVSLDFSLVILSSVSSAIVSRAMLGDFPS